MMSPSFSDVVTASNRMAPLLVDACLRGTAILLLAALATLLLRRASAALRHGIWLLAVIALLLLPILSAMLPTWNVLPTVLRTVAPPMIMAPLPAVNGIPVSTADENSAAVLASTSISHPSPTRDSSPTHVAPALQLHAPDPLSRRPDACCLDLLADARLVHRRSADLVPTPSRLSQPWLPAAPLHAAS